MTFEEAVEHVLRFEGGYVNDPVDPGGETRYGISKRAYPNEDIKNLTVARAKEIYKRDYWNKVRADELPATIRMPVFDMAVNMGIDRAVKILQTASGAEDDGVIGPETLEKARTVNSKSLLEKRSDFYVDLAVRRQEMMKYLKGWLRRAIAVS